MEIFHIYNIHFIHRGETHVRVGQFKGTNLGVAYLRCALKNPGCILVGAWLGAEPGAKGGHQGRITYGPASTIGIVTQPETEEEISCHKKTDGDATSPVPQSNPSQTAAKVAGETVPERYAKRRRWITGTFPAVESLFNGEPNAK
jgi:hypothetical protein